MAVKDQKLYVGGLGKEWTTAKGVYVNNNPQWVKVVGHLGDVTHLDWGYAYNAMRTLLGFGFPGYMIFESGVWNNAEKRWYFLPRRASKESYDEKLDERRATNHMVWSDEKFENIAYKTVGTVMPVRGYSSFKFVPNTNEKFIVALKTEEDSGETRSYVTVFNTNGYILVKDTIISDKFKFEGIEFV
jgi:soluble calcium-activated nucleotidase 1